MNPMFYIFNVSVGDRKWKHAIIIDGKWFDIDWDWYTDTVNETEMSSPRTELSKWDGCITGEIPVSEVKYITPITDRDNGPFYLHMHEGWLLQNHGITLPQ